MAVAAFERAALDQAALQPDQSLWSEAARAKYASAKAERAGVPLALLRIERLHLLAPVFAGTDALTLNRGVGVVEGTRSPGEAGNIALSAHRDSFFRSLKDIAVGDPIELETRRGLQRFRVAEIRIVDPLDVSVLDPSDSTVLTLITCHPFYFVGYAPDRYVVRATLAQEESTRVRVGL
ncbi:MAG TPA: class D sortase [Myxococcota bacterium]|jgi:sortase A